MKKTLTICLAFICSFVFAQSPTIPEKTNRFINDFANVIPDEKEESLASICKNIEIESSAQVVVVTTDDLDKDYPISDYSIQLAKKWGIGQKGVNNGLLILICPKNHKSRIEVGYELEGVLTDALTSKMQSEYFKPNFRQGDFYTGIYQVISAIKTKISPEAIRQRELLQHQQEKESSQAKENFLNGLMYVLFFGIIAVFLFFVIKKHIDRQRGIKEEQERKENEIKRQKLEAELAEKKLIESSKKLENDFINNCSKIKLILTSENDYLNANNVLKAVEDIINITTSELNQAKYADYKNIISESQGKINFLCSDILTKIEIKKNVYLFVNKTFPDLKRYETTFEEVTSKTKKFFDSYDKSIWGKSFDINDCSKEKFQSVYSTIDQFQKDAQNQIQNLEFDKALDLIKKAEDQILILKSFVDSIINLNEKINSANKYIESSYSLYNKIIQSIDETYNHKYVLNSTRKKWQSQRGNIVFSVTKDYSNPFTEMDRIKKFFTTLENYNTPALNNIEEETTRLKKIQDEEDRKRRERERKKREEEEEEERRRRNSSYSSSSSLYDFGSSSSSSSSSSDSGSSSFGGGDFGGGGSDSSW